MKKGVLIYALNNEQIDYTELAFYTAKLVKKYLNIPVALVTDSSDWFKQQHSDYKDTIDCLIKIVDHSGIKEWNVFNNYYIGDKVLYQNFIYEKYNDGLESLAYQDILQTCEQVYPGIEVDKWYPNLPYLAGQHVWHKNMLYRCHSSFDEIDNFSSDKFDTLFAVKDIMDQDVDDGDIFLYDRLLYMSSKNSNYLKLNSKIRLDLWKNTFERELEYTSGVQYRKYFDGALTHKRLKFKNDIRIYSYDLSPFDETLVIDCDYIINNDILKYCWEQEHDFLIHKTAFDLSGYRYDPRLHSLSDKSIDFYWATVFYFKKNQNTKTFFNLLEHIQENWNYYRYVFQIEYALYRNDYAFSIAIHIMNGYQSGNWTQDLPGILYYVTDRDVLLKHENQEMKFLVEKEKYKGEYTLIKTKKLSVHVMNKFSLSRTIRENENV